MIYKFVYIYNNNLIYENYYEKQETRAIAKFLWLTQRKIPFKVITYIRNRGVIDYGKL